MMLLLIGVCACIAINRSGRWYHAAAAMAAMATMALSSVLGYRADAGLGGTMWTATVVVVPYLVIGALTFYIVRALRDRTWNVLR